MLLSLPNSSRTSLIKAMTKKDKKSQPVTAEETRHSPDNTLAPGSQSCFGLTNARVPERFVKTVRLGQLTS